MFSKFILKKKANKLQNSTSEKTNLYTYIKKFILLRPEEWQSGLMRRS